MSYHQIARIIARAAEELASAGVPRQEADRIMMDAETKAVNCLAGQHRDFLECCKNAGTSAMAERLGMSKSQVRRRRAKILKDAHKSPITCAR